MEKTPLMRRRLGWTRRTTSIHVVDFRRCEAPLDDKSFKVCAGDARSSLQQDVASPFVPALPATPAGLSI